MDVVLTDMDRSYPFQEQAEKLDSLTAFIEPMFLLLNLFSIIPFAGHKFDYELIMTPKVQNQARIRKLLPHSIRRR